MKNGTISEYITPTGQVVMYEPNQTVRELSQKIQQMRHLSGDAQKRFHKSIYIWIVAGLISLIAGLVIPIRAKTIRTIKT